MIAFPNLDISIEKCRLLLFSVFVSFITYGFALTNYTLTVDSEGRTVDEFSLTLGRWGTTLVRYHIFHGLLPYFTMLLGIILLCLSAVELQKLFRFSGIKSYLFCALFLSFPQMAYQLVFTMQADAVPLGFLSAVLAMALFQKTFLKPLSLKSLYLLFPAST